MSAVPIEVHASEIHSSRTCLRKWHGVYVQSLREPDTANGAMARGTAIHAILEDYLNGKGPIDTTTEYGRIAASGLKYLPPVGSVHTELDFSFMADGWIYAGTIDMIKPYYVGDHKTTSNFKYQKTKEVLLEDPQAILYGTRAQLDGKSDIECQWIYYRTSGANKAQETRFIYPGSLLQENKQKLDEEVKAILSRRHLKILDLEPTPTACFKYGKPCHLRGQCHDLKPSIGSLMSISKDQLLADLKAKALGIGANPAGVQMPPPVAAVTPPGGLPTLPVLGGATGTPAATAQAVGGLPALPGAAARPAGGLPALPGAAAVTPPPASVGGLPALPGAAAAVAPVQTTIAPPGSLGGPPPLPPLPPPPSIDPAIAAAVAAETANKATKVKQPDLPNIAPPTAIVTAPAAMTVAGVAAAPEGLAIGTLYVDCLPIGEAVTPFSKIAGLCHDAIKEHAKVSHYKYAEFGKGPALWCDTVGMYLSAAYTESLYVDTSAGDGKDALEVLMRSAVRVIRGMR